MDPLIKNCNNEIVTISEIVTILCPNCDDFVKIVTISIEIVTII